MPLCAPFYLVFSLSVFSLIASDSRMDWYGSLKLLAILAPWYMWCLHVYPVSHPGPGWMSEEEKQCLIGERRSYGNWTSSLNKAGIVFHSSPTVKLYSPVAAFYRFKMLTASSHWSSLLIGPEEAACRSQINKYRDHLQELLFFFSGFKRTRPHDPDTRRIGAALQETCNTNAAVRALHTSWDKGERNDHKHFVSCFLHDLIVYSFNQYSIMRSLV